MEDIINIAELLKDAPKGTKLYSPLVGNCHLVGIKYVKCYVPLIEVSYWADSKTFQFRYDGKYNEDGECMLFPSKDCRTWENFKPVWRYKHFEPFQKVLVGLILDNKPVWRADIYSHFREDMFKHCTLRESSVLDKFILPYEGNEDKLGKLVEK